MRKLAVIASFAFIVWIALRRPAPVHSQAVTPDLEGQQFRIAVGVKDTEAKPWNGKITVTGGEILSLAGWRNGPQEHASPDGAFSFTTKIGLLENQLRAGDYFGATGFDAQTYRHLIPQGLLLKLKGSGSATVHFESASGTFEFRTDAVAYGARVPLLGGNATVERLPMELRVSEAGPADDHPALAVAPDGRRWIAWLSYQDKSDSVKVNDGAQTYNVGERGDLHAPAVAVDSTGVVHVVWARNENGAFQLYGSDFRNGRWTKQEALTNAGSSNFWPQLAADSASKRVALVWQSFRGEQSVIFARIWNGTAWDREMRMSEGRGNAWQPAVSIGGGKLWFAWDSYDTGAYQIYARQEGQPVMRITPGDRFSVRPSLAVTGSGQPLVAWEESDALWGKDFAYQTDRRGTIEYKNRRVRMATLDGGAWKALPDPMEAMPREIRRYVQQPELALDATGHLYMTLRSRTSVRNARTDFWSAGGRWETFLTHLDGAAWAPAVLMPASVGRNGMRSAVGLDRGQVYAVWATDNRGWMSNAEVERDVYMTAMPITGGAARLAGGAALTADAPARNPNPAEAEDVRRIRAYRYAIAGKQYRILRGDFHRHTELSQDGAGDGMLEDNYRYTLDAASMDIGYVSDHQMGQNDEYNWWITQKSNDLFNMPERFVPMYGYERSVPYPNGHRNVIWAERGKPVLRISPEEMQGKTNTGPVLYPYARETGAVVTSHTSATAQGTDWRDNDPALEPVVEIYQGYDANYEEPKAPRAWQPGRTQSHERNEPAGYVWNAWAKGYKLGVQSSSDHIATHTSYACVVTDSFTRQGILDAIRKRHTYAATDNIIMDFRIGTALMGDIIDSKTAPKLTVHIIGTAPLKQIDVIKNNKYVHQLTPKQKEARFEYADNDSAPGESYYYVRVEQTDGQLAWSSPIWVRR